MAERTQQTAGGRRNELSAGHLTHCLPKENFRFGCVYAH
jgi:hypothetical protein